VALFFFFTRLYTLQRLSIETTVIEHQYRLYSLRDKLREFAMSGGVNPDHWVFHYLDSSLAKTIDVLPRITLWWVVLTPTDFRKTAEFMRARNFLRNELAQPTNYHFAEIHTEYMDGLGKFILDRHPFIKWLVKDLISTRPPRIRTQWNRKLELQTEAPRTSTLQEYAPAA
jgi:hypothetical protein